MQLDTTDLRILQVMQEDGRISNQDLAERVALSPSACLRRVRMLEEGGAITGYRARLGRAALGLELEAIVQVSMRQDVSGWHETFMEAVQQWPEIVAAYIITGDCNYILRVQAPNLQHYSEFIIERLYKTPGVMDIRSNIVLRTLKEREGGLALLMEARGVRPLEAGAGKRGKAGSS
ncbi:Lrp/AsnC family transcriptional regulator [Ralstonia solanacearum]|nr:Lrp/AsnC family transcriptional regulator [Ralstonia solanacearum]